MLIHYIEDQPQAQTNVTTTVSNQPQLQKERHIMISYNHDTCLPICEKIDDRLKVTDKTH